MGNIRDYVVTEGVFTFEQKPFNECDNLVLSYLVYYEFEHIVPSGKKAIPLREAANRYRDRIGDTQVNVVTDFLFEIADSKRFGSALLSDYIYLVDHDLKRVQFTALNILFEGNLHYIAFRGIDTSLVGWREAFKMSYKIIPAQKLAKMYLERILKRENDKTAAYYVGGHSKGGSQAVYAAGSCDKCCRDLIKTVFLNDSPALREGILTEEEAKAVSQKTVKIVPEYSVIGMIFETESPDFIVKSTEKGVNQHEPMSWEIEDGMFVTCEQLNPVCAKVNTFISKWNASLTPEDKVAFINELFDYLDKKPGEAKVKVVNMFAGMGPKAKKACTSLVVKFLGSKIHLKELME